MEVVECFFIENKFLKIKQCLFCMKPNHCWQTFHKFQKSFHEVSAQHIPPFPSSPLSTYSAEFSMPLPSVTKHNAAQCTAMSKRSRERCRNPAAYGCRTCRIHGARRPESIKSGTAHPNYTHGLETLKAKRARSIKLAEIREMEALLFDNGLALGNRCSGRKGLA